MFSRIRYAARVLSYSPPKVEKCEEPDIVFEEETPQEVTKLSRVIGTAVEIFLVSLTIGLISAPMLHKLFPTKEKVGLATVTGIAAAVLAFIAQHFLADLNARIRLKLKIGDRIAPYFGHKILRTVHTLRG